MTNAWPPTLADVKTDAGIPAGQTDPPDSVIQARLSAAIAFVVNRRPDFNYDADPLSCLDPPTDDIWQGTVMLAIRLVQRRRSSDGMVSAGDMGVSRIASYDSDINRMLGLSTEAVGEFY
jgi:hypothetical protein